MARSPLAAARAGIGVCREGWPSPGWAAALRPRGRRFPPRGEAMALFSGGLPRGSPAGGGAEEGGQRAAPLQAWARRRVGMR